MNLSYCCNVVYATQIMILPQWNFLVSASQPVTTNMSFMYSYYYFIHIGTFLIVIHLHLTCFVYCFLMFTLFWLRSKASSWFLKKNSISLKKERKYSWCQVIYNFLSRYIYFKIFYNNIKKMYLFYDVIDS